jgi:hypothetical protein
MKKHNRMTFLLARAKMALKSFCILLKAEVMPGPAVERESVMGTLIRQHRRFLPPT